MWEFARKVLIAAAIVVTVLILLLLVWFARDVFLLAFAGVLFAVFLNTLAHWVSRFARLGYGWSLTVVVLALVVVVGLMGWFLQSRLTAQIQQLAETLPEAWGQLEAQMRERAWGNWLLDQASGANQALGSEGALTQITGIASRALRYVAYLIIILFVGVYCAAQPALYRKGFLLLVPRDNRKRAEEVLDALGYNMRWWLFGQLLSMVSVGVVTGLGLWLVGMPLVLALALLAFLFELIPNLGPFLAAVPALLVATSQGSYQVLYVALVYLVVQSIESYVVMPLVQRRVIWLPPALSILAVVLLGLVAGFLGVLVAAPLLAVIIVLVKLLYVEEILDTAVKVPGESGDKT